LGSADFAGALRVDWKSTVGVLLRKNSLRRASDLSAIGRIPLAVRFRRMQPELKKDVVGFERGIRSQERTPVAFRMLE
jgi:hypothetical protein